MNIHTLPKAEMESHLAEVIDTKDSKIYTLREERKILWICVGILITSQVLF